MSNITSSGYAPNLSYLVKTPSTGVPSTRSLSGKLEEVSSIIHDTLARRDLIIVNQHLAMKDLKNVRLSLHEKLIRSEARLDLLKDMTRHDHEPTEFL